MSLFTLLILLFFLVIVPLIAIISIPFLIYYGIKLKNQLIKNK